MIYVALFTLALFAAVTNAQLIIERRERAKAEREWRQERSELLNRIKPETAQAAPGEPEFPSPPGVIPDDDEAFWRSHGIDVSEVR